MRKGQPKLQGTKDAPMYNTALEDHPFTDREIQILRLRCSGMSVKEVCVALDATGSSISIKTVETHFANMDRKIRGYYKVRCSMNQVTRLRWAVIHGFVACPCGKQQPTGAEEPPQQ